MAFSGEPTRVPGRHASAISRGSGASISQPVRGTATRACVLARDRCEWVDRTHSAIGDRYHYIKNFMTDRPVAQPNFREAWPAIIRTRDLYEGGELTPTQALAYGPRPAEKLYDLKEDPHETVNLADDPDHQEILKAMRALVEAWIADTDDKGKYPESKAALAVTKKQFGRWCTDPIFDDV